MKLKKLGLADFEGVGTEELLEIRGGYGTYEGLRNFRTAPIRDVGGCEGDPNGFGGTYDADEVVVYGNGPRWYPSSLNSGSSNGSYVGTAAGYVIRFLTRVPSALLSTQSLGNPTRDRYPGGLPFGAHPNYQDPSSNC